MAPTPQDFAQALSASRLPALDWLNSMLPGAALLVVGAVAVAVVWMCWSEAANCPGHSLLPLRRHRPERSTPLA